ncbi:MAG: hypothetical protein FWG65_04830, partial [Turicibacter sp.]|nr:hypothetical protein [Turicibacter sp.]
EVRKAVAPNEFVNDTLNRKDELEQFREYVKRREQKLAQVTEQRAMEKMIIMAIKNGAPSQVIEAMSQSAGISDFRLIELKNQAQTL